MSNQTISKVSISCGNCGGKHGSVSAVRYCYDSADRTGDPIPSRPRPSAGQPATEKQMAFIDSLLEQRDHKIVDTSAMLTAATADKVVASATIKMLLNFDKKKTSATPEKAYDGFPTVKAGRYAVDVEGTVKFYKVDRPTEGPWAGRCFVKVQASDELHRIRNKNHITSILQAIVDQGVNECLARYGKLIGKCGVCNRTLTDETSRELGIGPVCRAAM